jgi:hypothetical protein
LTNSNKRIALIVLSKDLLSNTELTKDKVQLVFVGNGACDLAEVIQTLAYINREEISGETVCHAPPDGINAGGHVLKRLVMPGIGHNGTFTIQGTGTDFLEQSLFELLNAYPFFCSNPQYALKAKKSLKARLMLRVDHFIANQHKTATIGF